MALVDFRGPIRAIRWARRRARAGARRRPPRVVVFGSKGLPGVPATGGIERCVEQVTARLVRRGVRCLVYERADRAGWYRRDRVLVRQLPFLDSKNHAFWTHALLAALDYLAYREPDDVIHVHNAVHGYLCLFFRALGHRVIAQMHGQEWRAAKWGTGMSRFMQWSLRPMVAGSHVVTTVCEPSRRLLVDRFIHQAGTAERIVHIPNGLPDLPAMARPDARRFLLRFGLVPNQFVLYAGRLVPQKRVDVAIRAMARSGLADPLVIAGPPSHSAGYVRSLKRIVREYGLENRVLFVGLLDWPQLACLLRHCRALVLPSESEGCSNALLEAVSASANVVCTSLPENRAVMGEAARYMEPGDAGDLARALAELGSDDVRRRGRLLTARRARDLPTWDDVTEALFRLYWPDHLSACGRDEAAPLAAARRGGRRA